MVLWREQLFICEKEVSGRGYGLIAYRFMIRSSRLEIYVCGLLVTMATTVSTLCAAEETPEKIRVRLRTTDLMKNCDRNNPTLMLNGCF